jgi:hypothetical protein
MRRPWRIVVPLAFVLALAACGSKVELVAETDGPPPWRTAFTERAAFVAARDSNTLHVLPIDSAGQPSAAGRLRVPGRIDAMAARGTHVFLGVTLHQNALREPLTREWIGRGWLKVDERFSSGGAFLGGSNLVLFDVADPARPRFVSALITTPMPMTDIREIVLQESRAYLVTDVGVWLADVADPAAPRLVGRVSETGVAVAAGRHLYVAEGAVPRQGSAAGQNGGGGMTIVDVSNPAAPRVVGRLDAGALGRREDASVYGADVNVIAAGARHVYLDAEVRVGARTRDYLVTVDVSDPARPREVGRVEVDFLDGLVVRGATLYAYGTGGSRALVRRYDLSNPAAPRETGRYDLDETTDMESVGNLEAANGLVYVQNDDLGISVFRLPR